MRAVSSFRQYISAYAAKRDLTVDFCPKQEAIELRADPRRHSALAADLIDRTVRAVD
jgi:hypothetical protein